jgi:hypothetical protein
MVYYPKRENVEKVHLEAKSMLNENVPVEEVKKKIDDKHGSGTASETLKDFDKKSADYKNASTNINNKYVGLKETLDKISFGMGNLQFINILFYILMPSYWLIGIFLATRTYLVSRIELKKDIAKGIEKLKGKSYWYGAGLGYMFIFIAFAVTFRSVIAFSIFFLGIGILGALYMKSSNMLSKMSIPKDKKSHYLKWISYYGLPLTAIVMVIAGIVIDKLREPLSIPLGETSIFIYGYALLFMIAGLLLIISSYLQSNIKEIKTEINEESIDHIIPKKEAHDSFIIGLLIAGIIFFSVQTSLNYLLGLYLYETYESFTFVALLLAATLLAAFLSPLFFDKSTIKKTGKSFILLFGTGLALFLPLLLTITTHEGIKSWIIQALRNIGFSGSTHVISFMPLFYLIIGITGASIAGIAYSRITRELLQHDDMKEFSHKLGTSIGIGTAIFIMIFFLLREFTGQFWMSFMAITILYIITALLFARLVSTKSEQEYQKRRFESRINHNKL